MPKRKKTGVKIKRARAERRNIRRKKIFRMKSCEIGIQIMCSKIENRGEVNVFDKGEGTVNKEEERRFVSLKRLAKDWDTTPTNVRRLLREANVKAYRLSKKRGGTVRYNTEDVQRFLVQSMESSQETAP